MDVSKKWWSLGIGVFLIVGGGSVLYLHADKGTPSHETAVTKPADQSTAPKTQEGTKQPATPENHVVKEKVSKAHQALLKQFKKMASAGKLKGLADKFTVGKTNINDVYKEWGKPDKPVNGFVSYTPGMMKGTYSFEIGKADIVAQIRHFGNRNPDTPDESQIAQWEVTATLGTPSKVTHNGTDTILNYTTGKYLLQFVITKQTGKIDHVNVVSPKDEPSK